MKIPTGIPGLDDVLKGGLEKGWSYLIKGEPGTGKTIFGLQFLLAGEKSVYISFDEVFDEVKLQAERFGWSLDNIHFVDKVKEMDILSGDVLFYDNISDITEFIESITKLKELENVERVFIDGIGVLKDATKDISIYRRILSSIVNFLNSIGATTIISAEMTGDVGKDVISYLTSGEFVLRRRKRRDGRVFRTIEVLKYRGGDAYLGEHYFNITPKGIVVYPVIPVYKPKEYEWKLISTGNTELDKMLGGGILKGSKVYIAGKTGVGKTSLCLQILKANDEKGNVGILYAFDESKDEILRKYKEVFDYEPKKLVVREVEDISLGEFYNMVIEDIKLEPEIVAIDPLNAVDEMAISTAEFLSMLSLLKSQLEGLGITFIGIYEITQPISEFHFTGAGMSRFADYLIVGRHMEMEGELLKAIAIVKNRFGNHERTVRILDIESGKGLKIGEPLKEYSGIMSGVIRRVTS
ncbi:RecA-superfamily ATPase implicated in signal transduction [Archaeoglobus fulgidus DSM 8774]|uniref:RecA-superfamily ATPase implicated in signal transduction n=1 Tax=Archaeoglobus fulgidus DSM 8774 TaxID=1344584 RepID=A0A075WEY6_ARCFL|nr:ATPase domain-containing protein [Archaeoglobus fulgidus]AIG98357.1 RecA-superfamily ATPase implicated in signal transduction [Archaeoglobus fulgidus DSM 8774]